MKALLITISLVLFCFNSPAQVRSVWMKQESDNCSTVVSAKSADICYQTTDNSIWKCNPSVGTDCTIASDWIKVAAASDGTWGGMSGTLSNQTDLQAALNNKVSTTTKVNGYALSSDVTLNKTNCCR